MKPYILAAACGLMLLSPVTPAQAQGPIQGQRYQIPDGYSGYAAGTLIAYGGYNYVIQNDGTMLLANQSAGSADTDGDGDVDADDQGSAQAYQIPDGYAGYPSGTTITYGGGSYVIQSNGTMLLASQSSDAAAVSDQGTGPVYIVPDGYTAYPAGTQITYGGLSYTIGLNRTMVLVIKGNPFQSQVGQGSGNLKTNRETYNSYYGPVGSGNRPTTSGSRPGMAPNPGGNNQPIGTGPRRGGGGYRQPVNGGIVGNPPRLGPAQRRSTGSGFAENNMRPGGGGFRPPMIGGRRGR